MITTPTVLVLGAGASAPYGFPVASELKEQICNAFVKDSVATRLLHEGSQIPMNVFPEFREAFHRSGQSSVDAFLEHRPEFVDVGKLAIACCLIPYESEDALFEGARTRGGDSYQYMSQKLSASFEKFGENQLSIITFNYDRSLEHYLLTTLRHAHGRSDKECAQMVRKIPIVHVYGQLGKHPYPNRNARPYNPQPNGYEQIASAAAGITLLHEAEPEIEAAHQILMAAQTICFLGFSYHQLNLGRLRIRESGSKKIFGTASGLIGDELQDVRHRVHEALHSSVTLEGTDNLQMLRQHLILG